MERRAEVLAPLLAILALATPLALGDALLRLCGDSWRGDLLGRGGRSFPVGALLVGLLVFASMALGAGVGAPLVIATSVLTLGLQAWSWRSARRRARDDTPRSEESNRGAETLALPIALLCFVPLVFSIGGKAGSPVFQDDDASIWTLKAKVLYEHGRIDDELAAELDEKQKGGHHFDYPLLNPLLQVWMMSVAGRPLDVEIRWPTHLWLVSLVLMILSACRRYAGPLMGSLLCLSVTGAASVRLVGLGTKSDVIVMVGLLGLVDAVLRAIEKDRDASKLGVGALFAAILVWSKNEGLMLAVVVLIAAAIAYGGLLIRRAWRSRTTLIYLLPILVVGVQLGFNRRYDLRNDLMTGGQGQDSRSLTTMLVENFPERGEAIARSFWQLFTRFDLNHGLYLVFFALVILCPKRSWDRPRRFPALVGLGGLAAFFLVYVISFEGRTEIGLYWHLSTSAHRVLLQLLPVMVLFCAMIAGQLTADRAAASSPTAQIEEYRDKTAETGS